MASVEHKFPCVSCGADLRFQPGTTALVCDHCGVENALPEETGRDHLEELDFAAALAEREAGGEVEETRFSKCENCGAEIEYDEQIHATECAFCAAPLVTDTGTHRRIKPAALLPFRKSEKEVRAAMTKWLGRLWFAPNGLQDYAKKGRAMTGIYVPFWTYDADTKSKYRGQRGTIYYETRMVQVEEDGKTVTREEQVQKIRWTPARGRVARFFDDILVVASKSLPRDYIDALEPWDLEALEPYRPDYLAGFQAEGYTIPLETGYREARDHMDRVIDSDVRRDIGGDRQQVEHVETVISDVTFKHILLPVWMAAYSFRGKTYRFVVNARSGQVRGERPWSWVKITFAVITAIVVIAILVLLFGEG